MSCMKGMLPTKKTFGGLFLDMTMRKWFKYALFSLNAIIMLFALIVIGFASHAINQKAFMEGPSPGGVIAALTICLVCFLVAVLGIISVVKDNRILLIVYSAVIGTIFICKLTLLVMFATSGFDLDARFVAAYRQNGRDSALFDTLFRTLECCGMNGTNDFYAPKVRNNIIPKGCCREKQLKGFGKTKICTEEFRFPVGCHDVMGRSGNPVSARIKGLVIVFSLFVVVELFAIGTALFLVFKRPPPVAESSD